MPERVIYAYAIIHADRSAELDLPDPVPLGEDPTTIREGSWSMIVSRVPSAEYSQESIDQHADDLEWLGTVGVGHQRINGALAESGDVIPLRAFTLFSDDAAIRSWLGDHAEALSAVHEHLAGKLEWTLKLQFEGTGWIDKPDVEAIRRQIDEASEGKAYLLQKKLERELDQSREEMENDLVRDLAAEIENEIDAEVIVETRLSRGGGDPQIDLLFERAGEDELHRILDSKRSELEEKGIIATVTGPWPAYSFTGRLT